ncbi:MAG TPA: hypothetical protein VFW65_02830 [Pseudonocardiaceae bacterium]|nr:hypothetical protein [Pseudonocardiaceae bacterium]
MDAQAVAVLGQPPTQPRPVPDQRLVGDLQPVVVDGDQPGLGQPLHRGDHARVGQVQLGRGDPPLGVLGTVAQRDQSQEQRLRQPLFVLAQTGIDQFCRPRDGMPDAARGLIAGQGQRRPAAPQPGLPQRVRQQWQHAVLSGAVGHDLGDQRRLHHRPGLPGRSGDRCPELLGRHRAHQELAPLQFPGQAGVLGAVAVEVGAHAQDHPHPAARPMSALQQQRDEPATFRLLGADGEDLLELVDHHEQVGVRGLGGQCGPVVAQGALARRQHDVPAAVTGPARDQTRPQQ